MTVAVSFGQGITMTTWLPVVGYEGLYEVSSEGAVRGCRRKGSRGGLLTTSPRNGYPSLGLYAHGRGRMTYVHRIVAAAFHGPCPEGQEVRHLDGCRTNNTAANLTYGTPSENNYDRVRHGTHPATLKTHCPYGHEYSEANTKQGRHGRECRECGRRWRREYEERQRAKVARAA
jgi:hypothetical protein